MGIDGFNESLEWLVPKKCLVTSNFCRVFGFFFGTNDQLCVVNASPAFSASPSSLSSPVSVNFNDLIQSDSN